MVSVISPNLINGMFIGKEVIEMKSEIEQLKCVKSVLDLKCPNIDAEVLKSVKTELMFQILPSCHGEHVTRLPDDAVLLGGSKRGPNEIWNIGNRVLCI